MVEWNDNDYCEPFPGFYMQVNFQRASGDWVWSIGVVVDWECVHSENAEGRAPTLEAAKAAAENAAREIAREILRELGGQREGGRQMTEWKAEMPPRHHPRAHASDDRVCSEGDVEALVTRANEELGKVRAERDAAMARVRELTEWRPMETAGTEATLCLMRDGGIIISSRLVWGLCVRDVRPLGWLPLPEPPKEVA